jgi:hypothetical protein
MALPPSITGIPPAGSSPAAVQSGNPGANAQAVAQVREAIQMLSATLPQLPVGSEMQTAVAKVVADLSKKFPEQDAAPGVQMSAIRDLAQRAQQQQAMQALMRQQGGGAQGGPEQQPQQPPMM